MIHFPLIINDLKITLKAVLKEKLNHFIVQSFSEPLLNTSAW